MKRLNLVDEKFGRLIVKEFACIKDNRSYWRCECVCGNEVEVYGSNLRCGYTKSCGCLRKESSAVQYVLLSEEKKQEISNARKGENSPNWNPNLTNEDRIDKRIFPKYKKWREEVFKIDNYICQKCEQLGGDLNAHHIESYRSNPHLRTEVSNGIILCKDCHSDFHHQYGRGDNTRAQLIEFLRSNNNG